MKRYSVTVTAVYIGEVEIEAEDAETATLLAYKHVAQDGTMTPDLTFSGYKDFDNAEEIENDRDLM